MAQMKFVTGRLNHKWNVDIREELQIAELNRPKKKKNTKNGWKIP